MRNVSTVAARSEEQRAAQQRHTGNEPCATGNTADRAEAGGRVTPTTARAAAAVRVLARTRASQRGLSRSLAVRDV